MKTGVFMECFQGCQDADGGFLVQSNAQWMGLRKKLQENTIFNGKIHGKSMVSCGFSLKPIH